jgi:hypothetical protein
VAGTGSVAVASGTSGAGGSGAGGAGGSGGALATRGGGACGGGAGLSGAVGVAAARAGFAAAGAGFAAAGAGFALGAGGAAAGRARGAGDRGGADGGNGLPGAAGAASDLRSTMSASPRLVPAVLIAKKALFVKSAPTRSACTTIESVRPVAWRLPCHCRRNSHSPMPA